MAANDDKRMTSGARPAAGEAGKSGPVARGAVSRAAFLEARSIPGLELVEFTVRYEEELACLAGEGVLKAHRVPQGLR